VNAFKLIKNVSVAALLASICAPFAVGCAAPVEGDDAAPVAVSTQALTEQKLGLTPADAIEKMAIALAEAAAGKVAHQLFPEPGIDLEKLLSDIDANTRRAILDEALRQDKGAIYAAMEELNDVESNKSHIGEAGRKTAATLYNEAHDLPSLASLNQVRAKLGPDASSDVYKRDGIKLYATAVQIDAGRLMLLSSLDAAQAVSNREELVRHLKVAVAHVRATAKAGRQAEFDARLGLIGACHQYHETRSGSKVDHYTQYVDNASGAKWGRNDSYDYATAMGRCDADRDGHYGRVEAAVAANMDAKYGTALAMADQWQLAVDALEGKDLSSSDVTVGLDFGGMWGWSFVGGQTVVNVNPFTGNASCPSGYDQVKISGKYNVDYDAFQCVRQTNGSTQPVADFGGMFGERDYREQIFTAANPVTGQTSCAAGFTQYKLLGGDSTDRNLWYCARPHVPGTPSESAKFGGAFSRAGGFANPLSGGSSCSNGYTPSQVWGSNGQYGWRNDQAIVVCTKK
jgi:hypothetical protein